MGRNLGLRNVGVLDIVSGHMFALSNSNPGSELAFINAYYSNISHILNLFSYFPLHIFTVFPII